MGLSHYGYESKFVLYFVAASREKKKKRNGREIPLSQNFFLAYATVSSDEFASFFLQDKYIDEAVLISDVSTTRGNGDNN